MKALYVGSFDPFTLGHENIAKKGKALFNSFLIGIGDNIHKKNLFSKEERKAMIPDEFEVVVIDGLVSDYVKKIRSTIWFGDFAAHSMWSMSSLLHR